MLGLFLITFLSSTSWGQEDVKIIDTYFSGTNFETPLYPSAGTVERKKQRTLIFAKQEFQKMIKASAVKKDYSSELLSFGDCKSSTSKSLQNCQVMMISHRDFKVNSDDPKKIMQLYTSDLRNPFDKTSKIQHVKIEREHWEFNDSNAFKVSDINQVEPMQEDNEYTIKKCRHGAFLGWQCNDIHYKLFKVDESTYLLLGKLQSTKDLPRSYQQNGKNIDFTQQQVSNSVDGTISIVLVKKHSASSSVFVHELTLSSVSNSANAHKLMISKHAIEQGLNLEYKVLANKFLDLRKPASK